MLLICAGTDTTFFTQPRYSFLCHFSYLMDFLVLRTRRAALHKMVLVYRPTVPLKFIQVCAIDNAT
jgi:hypothetical protein